MPALKPLGKTHSISPTAMLNDALARLTIAQLKSLMRWLPDTSPTGKKDLGPAPAKAGHVVTLKL
ncbi:hypothetical protein [Burkholderia ubonensis]|uniref:hypothetical protein n=1 Tax=Burkholderia ubonensis TaxID=101571 RepID=UPI0012FC52E7|nr:hypothetical protein [Burkholderia ubonensis]